MAEPGFNATNPTRIYTMGGFGNTPRAVMNTSGIFSLDPNEGPTPSSTPAPAGGAVASGGFFDALRDLLPSIINAGAEWYGSKNAAGQYQAAANQSTGKPIDIQSLFGGLAYDPATGIKLTPGQPMGPWAGASPELIGAFNQLNDQGAIQQEANGRLDLLRQLAAPEEARATQNLQQQLFSQGRLGGTGGAVQQEALARAQGQADLERTLASQDWARNNALQRFNAATGVIGSGQAQRQIDVNTALNLGQLGVQAGRPPAADLLAAMAGSKDAQLRSIFGTLGGNDEGGIGGVLGGLLGKGLGALGGKVGGTFGSILGGIGDIFSGNSAGNFGQMLSGGRNVLGSGLSGLGNLVGDNAVGNALQSAGNFIGGGSGILGGLGAIGSGAAANSALLGAGFGGSSAGFLGGAGTGIGSGALTPLGSLAGGGATAAGGTAAAGGAAGAAGAGAGTAATTSGALAGLGTAVPVFAAALAGMGALGKKTEAKYAPWDAALNSIMQPNNNTGLKVLLSKGLNITGKSGSHAKVKRPDGTRRAFDNLIVLPNGRQLRFESSGTSILTDAFKSGNSDNVNKAIAELVASNAGAGPGDPFYTDPALYPTIYG